MKIEQGIADLLRNELFSLGASKVGFADLTEIKIRPYPELYYGISIMKALGPDIVKEITKTPTLSYRDEYEEVNIQLDMLAETTVVFFAKKGYQAKCMPSTSRNYLPGKFLTAPFSHKMTATLAGLGWVGKTDLLVTEEYGSAVRLNTVFVNAHLPAGVPIVASKCGECSECVRACPAGASKGKNWQPGIQREELLDIHSCYEMARNLSGILKIDEILCGVCMTACPWTKKYIGK